MALSSVYIAFLGTTQILFRQRSDGFDLAIDVVMLRHEVAVLRRQVARLALQPKDRALLAGLSRLMPRAKLHRFFVQPDTLRPLASRAGASQVDLPKAFWSSEAPRTDNAGGGSSGQGNPDAGYRRIKVSFPDRWRRRRASPRAPFPSLSN